MCNCRKEPRRFPWARPPLEVPPLNEVHPMNSLTIAAVGLAATAAAGFYFTSSSSRPLAAEAVHEVPSPAADSETVALEPTLPSTEIANVVPQASVKSADAMNRLSREYGVGPGTPEELDLLWENASAEVDPASYEALARELEHRATFFNSFLTSLENEPINITSEMVTDMTESEFYVHYSSHALQETAFLVDACKERRMRITPFFPLPTSITTTTHPSAQLVSHYSAELNISFVARLESDEEPDLFLERIQIGYLAQSVLGAAQRGVETLRARTRQDLGERFR